MTVDKFGRSPKTEQNVTNVSGVSHEYVNSNFLRKSQAIDMSGQRILNLGKAQGPKDAVKRKYVNERFFKKGDPIDMNQKPIKNVLSPTEEGDVATKGYVDSKSAGENDLDMRGHLVKNVRWPEEYHDSVNRANVYFVANSKLSLEGGTMQGDIRMGQHSIRNIHSNPQHEDEVVPKQWIEENFLNRYSSASTMAKDLNMNHISYLGAPEQNHHAATKGYTDTKLLHLGGSMQGGIGMAGNRIRHLGEPLHDNDALRLSSANDYYLRRDGANWRRADLSLGGRRLRGVVNPQTDQDGVTLRTLQDLATSVLDQATVAANPSVGDTITNHANILNRDIGTKSLNLDPRGTATKNFSMGEQFHIDGLADPTLEHEAVNPRTLNRKVLNEIRVNNLLESQKYLRLDGQNQMVSDLQMNDHKIVGLADATPPADSVNKRTLDAAVKSLRSENEQLILATNENISQRVMFLDGTSLPENHQSYNGKRITNLGAPVEDTDAKTKGFIDNQLRKRTFHVTPEGAQGHLKMNNH